MIFFLQLAYILTKVQKKLEFSQDEKVLNMHKKGPQLQTGSGLDTIVGIHNAKCHSEIYFGITLLVY